MLARPWRNMMWSSASSTLIGPFVLAFVIWFSPNTSRSVPLVGLEKHCTGLRLFGPRVVSLYFDDVGDIPTVLPASSSAIHRSAWKGNSAKSISSVLHSQLLWGFKSPPSPIEY